MSAPLELRASTLLLTIDGVETQREYGSKIETTAPAKEGCVFLKWIAEELI